MLACGAARFGWNWGLARCRERYAAEGKWYSAVDLHRLWNAQKKADPALAWWAGNSKCAYHCDTRSHAVSECVEGGRLMPGT